MKRVLKAMLVLLIFSTLIVGCSSKEDVAEVKNEMQQMEIEKLKEQIESEANEYIIIDARKTQDYETSHIVGSVLADQHAANKEGDDEAGIANLKATIKEVTGNETGNEDSKYVIVCYSGNSYAQKATDLMIDMGIAKENIYTLKGGMKAWEEAGDEYKRLLK